MRIAVTGATGFLGGYVVRQLAEEGHTPRLWYRPDSDRGGLEQHASLCEWVPGDLSDPDSMPAFVRGCDGWVHAALWRPGRIPARRDGGEGDLVRFAETNLPGTLRLIEAARSTSVQRIVFVSTCAVHERILDDRPLDETHPCWPTSHHGAHKAALEMFVHSYGLGHGVPICAIRPCGIYGIARPVEASKWFSLVRNVGTGKHYGEVQWPRLNRSQRARKTNSQQHVALFCGRDCWRSEQNQCRRGTDFLSAYRTAVDQHDSRRGRSL